jgi:hypothetical protein
MSKQENSENPSEDTVTYVYIPDEGVYGTIIQYGTWGSMIEYYYNGVQYKVQVPNEDFIVLDEIGIGYIDEKDENL